MRSEPSAEQGIFMSDQKNNSKEENNLISRFYGSGLFLKFFFWFWLTVVLTGIFVAVYGYFYHFRPESRRLFSMGREMLEENGQMAIDVYETAGIEQALSVKLPGAFWLYNDQLQLVFSPLQSVSKKRRRYSHPRYESLLKSFEEKEPEVREVARRLFAGEKIESTEVAGEMLVGSLLTSESGKKYVIISHFPQKMPRPEHFIMGRVIDTMPFYLLITAIFCYALSRYMVGPIAELRQASRDFAGGKLDARVTGSAIRRHDEVGDLAIDFNDMADKIEQMIRAQRRLFGDISHELRSPLARLQVAAELLQKKLPATEQPMLTRIEKEVARINSLIEEVLQFSRLETGNINEEKRQIDLNAILTRICNDASFEGKARNCQVSLKMAADCTISGRQQLIERAIENVLRNAIKYSPENSQVEVTLSEHDRSLVIRIADRGPGVSEADIGKLFEPFYRCAEDRNRSTGGTGLGLAIALHAVKLHNGSIRLKNRDGGGFIAEIILPGT